MRAPLNRRRAGSRGYVMIAVLWLGVALLIALAAFLSGARHDALEARAEIAAMRADMLARSGLNIALAELGRTIAGTQDGTVAAAAAWPRDGRPVEIEMAEGRVEIRIEDEAGKVDLRTAPPQLLAPVLAALGARSGIDAFAAANLAEGFADLNPIAGERPVDLRALLRANGLDDRAVAVASRHLTLMNGTAKVNPETASAVVLGAVPGLGPSDVQTLLARRGTDRPLPQLGTATIWLVARYGPVYTIRVRADLAGGGTAHLSAMVGSRGLGFRGGRMQFEVLSFERAPGDAS